MKKANKASGTGLALFTEASGTLSMEWRLRALSREGLRSPGRKVNPQGLCAPGDQPEKERERDKESKTQGPKLWWSRDVLFNIVYLYCLTRQLFSAEIKSKLHVIKETWGHSYEKEKVIITFTIWFIKRKRVVNSLLSLYGNARVLQCYPTPPPPRRSSLLLHLIPEHSEINKGQRICDRSKTTHRKPPVKCFLTNDLVYIL